MDQATGVLTLTGFLLARIAEDEVPTYSLVPYDCPGHCAPAGWVGSQCRYCDSAPVYGGTVAAMMQFAEDHAERIHQRSRVLADLEGKRRIVAWHSIASEQECPGCWWDDDHGCPTLRLLTLPYADHPDYRPEWRP